MFCFTKKLFLSAVTIFTLYGLVLKTDALYCRDGIENSVGFVFRSRICTESQPACFGSVKCSIIGDTNYKDYEWDCIDKGQCSNGTGTSFAHYKGIKGICCFTNNCNINIRGCTDSSGLVLTGKWISIVLATAVAYILI